MDFVNENQFEIIAVLLLAVLSITLINTYQISNLQSGVSDSSSVSTSKASDSGGYSEEVKEIQNTVLPEKGSPTGYGVKYSQEGMQRMVSWQEDITLSGSNRERYIRIGNKDGTACEYCCGATSALRSDGSLACGCAHNHALAGLIKHLVKNTDMTDQEIMNEVKNWKAYFFPKKVLQEELQKRGISPSAAGLPQMRGGC